MQNFSNFSISFFAYFDKKEQFARPQDTYETNVLFALKHGSFRYKIGNSDWYIAKENAIVLCPSGMPFYREMIEPTSLLMAKFTVDANIALPLAPIYSPENARVQGDMEALCGNGFVFTDTPDAKICHYMADLWYTATADLLTKKLPLHEAYDYICTHFWEDISINAMAQNYGYTPPRLITLFNKHYGAPPKNIISNLRIEKARRLLLQSDLSVGEIAQQCGYEDTLYFSRIFSKYCGLSPSQFRKKESL